MMWARPAKPRWAGEDFRPAFHCFKENEAGILVSLCGIIVLHNRNYELTKGVPEKSCRPCMRRRIAQESSVA